MQRAKRVPLWLNVAVTTGISAFLVWRLLALIDTEEEVFRDPQHRARIRLSFAQQYAESLAVHSRMPQTLDALLSGLSKDRRRYFEFDPWNQRIRFVEDSIEFELRSAGPDGRFNSDDDVAVRGKVK